jgi:hypothetical protein
MSAMMKLHARMMADSVIRQRVMADSVMRGLMAQVMDSAGAAQREHNKHEGHGEQMGEPSGRNRPPAKPPAPAPRPAKPDSSDVAPHDQHSARAAAAPGRAT